MRHLIKTLLALHHQVLPPSLKFDHAPENSPLLDSPFRVQTGTAPWPLRKDKAARRAAVSAFGFGGINAHILLEEWRHDRLNSPAMAPGKTAEASNSGTAKIQVVNSASSGEPVAVVGIDLHLGPLEDGKFRA